MRMLPHRVFSIPMHTLPMVSDLKVIRTRWQRGFGVQDAREGLFMKCAPLHWIGGRVKLIYASVRPCRAREVKL